MLHTYIAFILHTYIVFILHTYIVFILHTYIAFILHTYRVSHKTLPTLFSVISQLSDDPGIKIRTFLKSPRNSLLKNV